MTVSRLAGILRSYPLPIMVLVGLSAGLCAQFAFDAPDAARVIWLVTLVVGGLPVLVSTAWGMVHGRFAADIVASMAVLGAAVTQEFFAGCVIVLMQTGGEALESYAVHRASASLEALLKRAPTVAHRRRGDSIEDVPVTAVEVGDRLAIRPGDVIPVDGRVLSGTASVDESALTGEPIPVFKQQGAELMSGSIAVDGALDIEAIRVSTESEFQQIVRLVQEAQAKKAPIGRLADRYAIFFTPLTLLVCVAAYALTREAEAVVAVLVVATPCPLILATPVAIISGINRAAGHGVIVKNGAALEQVGQATAAVFDKTGTLTTGTPAVSRVVAVNGYNDSEVLRLAASLEQLSTHPMARALVEEGTRLHGALPFPHDLTEVAGQGVSGTVEGHSVDVGSIAYAELRCLGSRETLHQTRMKCNEPGASAAIVGIDHTASGLVLFADSVREGAASLVTRLRSLGVRDTEMLTGDDFETAHVVARQIGITAVHADLLPGQKVQAIERLRQHHTSVVMVGDGINDAPALATATVGIALGAHGAAISADAADIVITTDDIDRVADAVEVGRHTLAIAKQSIWVGLGASATMMGIAALGYIPPAVGAMLQEALDVAVIVNALRAR